MAWVVDTCVLIDLLEDDPDHGVSSASRLEGLSAEGLVICPITYAELAPAFEGNREVQDEFLKGIPVDFRVQWTWQDTLEAHAGWHRQVRARRARETSKRPLADILVGAFSRRFQGLVSRNPADFLTAFPELVILTA